MNQHKAATLMSNCKFYTQAVNRLLVEFDKEELELLKLGSNCAFQTPWNSFINQLIIETEDAIEHSEIPVQNT